MTNGTKLGRHLMLAFGIPDIKAYLGLQQSDNLTPVFVRIWSAFAKCQPESPGLTTSSLNFFDKTTAQFCRFSYFLQDKNLVQLDNCLLLF